MKYTTGGRKVFSGGGIEPDLRFDGPVEGFNADALRPLAVSRGLFAELRRAVQRRRRHAHRPLGPDRASIVKKNFAVDDAMVEDFKAFVIGRNVKIDEEAWTKDLDFIRAMIRYNIDEAVFDVATARQHLVDRRPAGAVRDFEVPRGREAARAVPHQDRRESRPVPAVSKLVSTSLRVVDP